MRLPKYTMLEFVLVFDGVMLILGAAADWSLISYLLKPEMGGMV